MTAIYHRSGKPFATYGLWGDGPNAEALRLMAWVTASMGWDWRIS